MRALSLQSSKKRAPLRQIDFRILPSCLAPTSCNNSRNPRSHTPPSSTSRATLGYYESNAHGSSPYLFRTVSNAAVWCGDVGEAADEEVGLSLLAVTQMRHCRSEQNNQISAWIEVNDFTFVSLSDMLRVFMGVARIRVNIRFVEDSERSPNEDTEWEPKAYRMKLTSMYRGSGDGIMSWKHSWTRTLICGSSSSWQYQRFSSKSLSIGAVNVITILGGGW
ncbi:hypothetical protein BJ878DRAFT_484110 [Calycina marina]|uniref:Uncharacterized protein n=1 Tax=Calycina marina TaxID=1763456 RepID=A0A9P7YUP0_9HELO|nr:hypothetical protein BJ878DRAFT_484110 [Calycina marina]